MMNVVPRCATVSALQRSLQPVTSTRQFSSTVAAMVSKPKFSDGSDEAVLTKELDDLISRRWSLTDDGQGIERSFKFKTFAKTWVSRHDCTPQGVSVERASPSWHGRGDTTSR